MVLHSLPTVPISWLTQPASLHCSRSFQLSAAVSQAEPGCSVQRACSVVRLLSAAGSKQQARRGGVVRPWNRTANRWGSSVWDVVVPGCLQQWGGLCVRAYVRACIRAVGSRRRVASHSPPSHLPKPSRGDLCLGTGLSLSAPTGCRRRWTRSSVLRGTLTVTTWGDCSTCPRCGGGREASGHMWVLRQAKAAAPLNPSIWVFSNFTACENVPGD